ncbi:hypothetical protein EYF80_016900 [Liparis tanakae]|uniref:Uncharacterized protein n=1 Tax=Liparis tanakae TaxID=230148 RepID=A0A4Z2I3Z6_9TELE|nr:hypothetical protein EYF80_016900 [Liparis tanakae]
MRGIDSPRQPITMRDGGYASGRCLYSYLSGRYRLAEQSSFTVRARGSAEDGRSPARRDRSEASAAAGFLVFSWSPYAHPKMMTLVTSSKFPPITSSGLFAPGEPQKTFFYICVHGSSTLMLSINVPI